MKGVLATVKFQFSTTTQVVTTWHQRKHFLCWDSKKNPMSRLRELYETIFKLIALSSVKWGGILLRCLNFWQNLSSWITKTTPYLLRMRFIVEKSKPGAIYGDLGLNIWCLFKSWLFVRRSCEILGFCKPFPTHTRKVFTLSSINKRTDFFWKPFLFWTPVAIFERFVTSFVSQELSLSASVSDFPLLYAELPNSHTAPPRPWENGRFVSDLWSQSVRGEWICYINVSAEKRKIISQK